MSQDTITRTTHTITSSDGTTIAYEKTGTGPAVVIVDGALCYREFGPTRALAEALAPNYTAYFYDRRGRGESGDTQPYAVQREIEDLAAIIAAAGGDAYVFGQSSGAGIALEAAASGVRMRKLAVYEAPYVGLAGDVDHVAKLQSYLTDDKRGAAVGHFMVKMVGAPAFVPLMMRLMPKVWKQLRGVAHTLPNDAMVMDGFNVPTARLGTITVPTLVMGGSKGAENMKAAVRGVAEAVPGSQQRTLDGQTHQVSEHALLPELREFFR